MKLLDVARRIEKQLSNPMGDRGIDLDLFAALRVAIAEETETTGTDAAIQSLAVERSGSLMRAMIETDAHIRAREMLAALGAAAALERNIRQLVELLTANPRHPGGGGVTETRQHEWDAVTITATTDGGVGVIWRRYSDGLLVVARKGETPEQALARHLLHDSPGQIN